MHQVHFLFGHCGCSGEKSFLPLCRITQLGTPSCRSKDRLFFCSQELWQKPTQGVWAHDSLRDLLSTLPLWVLAKTITLFTFRRHTDPTTEFVSQTISYPRRRIRDTFHGTSNFIPNGWHPIILLRQQYIWIRSIFKFKSKSVIEFWLRGVTVKSVMRLRFTHLMKLLQRFTDRVPTFSITVIRWSRLCPGVLLTLWWCGEGAVSILVVATFVILVITAACNVLAWDLRWEQRSQGGKKGDKKS